MSKGKILFFKKNLLLFLKTMIRMIQRLIKYTYFHNNIIYT